MFSPWHGFRNSRRGTGFATVVTCFEVGAAPHLPAGIFSPLNGEKGLAATPAPFYNAENWRKHRRGPLSPRLRGEMPGRAM